MVNHTRVWQLKNAISERISLGTMTEEHLTGFVAMSKEDLDRVFRIQKGIPEQIHKEATRGVL